MSLSNFDMNLLVVFEALMAEQSVTRAGARIGRSQPAMSAALARLRVLTEDELFVRGPKGLQPTPRAVGLIGPIGNALAEIRRSLHLNEQFDPTTSTTSLTIAMTDFPASLLMPKIVSILRTRAPKMSWRFSTFIARNDATNLLDSGEADITISVAPDPTARILKQPLFEETFCCLLRSGHPAISNFDLDTFSALPHLLVSPEGERYGFVDAALAKKGLKREIALVVPQLFAVPAIIAESNLVATVPARVLQNDGRADSLCVLNPPIDLEPLPFFLCWHRRNDTHPMLTWARSCIIELLSDVTRSGESVAVRG
jgi:DNA-binding transcriptional LysR family regulator